MRIAVGSMMHETNTFTTRRTPLQDFSPVEGLSVYESDYWMKNTPVGGIISTLRKNNVEIVPIYFAGALPSGIVTSEAYQQIKEKILSGIKDNISDLDGICLALHGSMFVEDVTDPEGDLLATLKQEIPKEIPISCALDLHGTITEAMITNANAFVGYRTAPHIDMIETGSRSAQILVDSLHKKSSLVMRRSYLPLLISGEQSETDSPPMTELLPLLDEIEQIEGIASASLFVGFPWADSPHCGVNAVLVGEKTNLGVLDDRVRWLASKVWERRVDFKFTTESWPLDEAIQKGLEDPRKPIVISDTGDNPTAGASQDLTIVVKGLLDNKVSNAVVAVVVDASAIDTCSQASEGDLIQLRLGRASADIDADPLLIEAKLVTLQSVDGNRFAVIDKDGVFIVICESRMAVTEPDLLVKLGLKPQEFKIIVVKSGYISPEYQSIAARKLFALTDGDTNLRLEQLQYENVPRPIFPLDKL